MYKKLHNTVDEHSKNRVSVQGWRRNERLKGIQSMEQFIKRCNVLALFFFHHLLELNQEKLFMHEKLKDDSCGFFTQ